MLIVEVEGIRFTSFDVVNSESAIGASHEHARPGNPAGNIHDSKTVKDEQL
jgi:hypothetical protein